MGTDRRNIAVFLVSLIFLIPFSKASTEISDCSTLNSAGATYLLTADIIDSTNYTCMEITANNVILDCQGHTIDSNGVNGQYAIYDDMSVATNTNITIKNCIITDWTGAGMYLRRNGNDSIYNNTITNVNWAIINRINLDNSIYNNTISGNNYNLEFVDSSDNLIYDNIVTNAKYTGVVIDGSSNNSFYNNFFNNTDSQDVSFVTDSGNYWNTTNQIGTRVYSRGTNIGGNYYAYSNGAGYSDTCTDANQDGFCDTPYDVCSGGCVTNNTDYLPLTNIPPPVYSKNSSDSITYGESVLTNIIIAYNPTYSENSTSSTAAGTNIQHDLRWASTGTLSGYNFSWCNGTYLKSVPNYQTTTYNFLDNVSNNAYWASPANPITKPNGGTQATAVQYTNMSSNNSAYARAGSDATNDDPYWNFNFTINDTRSTVNWINITLGGFKLLTLGTETATCYVWNDTSGTYISLGNLGTTPTLLTVNYSTQQQTLINSTTKVLNVQCTGISFDSGEYVYIDFVSVNVGNLTYSAVSSDCSDGDAILTNDSWTAFTSGMCGAAYTDCWSNVSKVVNSTVGSIIKWCFSVNDSDNQWNSTSCNVPFNYTTTQGAQNYPKILYDYSTYAELAPRNFSMTRSMFLSIGYSELPVISALFPRIVYDSVTYAEWATNTKGFVRYFYDSMTYAELQLTNSTFIKTLYESVAYSELISRTLVLGRNFYDTATYAESAVRNSTFLRAFYDTFTYAERQTNNFVFGRTIYDYFAYAELPLRNYTFARIFYDYATYAESIVRQFSFTRAFYDSMTYAEWQLKNSTFIRTLYDSATYAELASRASIFSKTLYDYATYVESVVISVAKVYTQTLYDYATYAELVVKTVIFQRTFYDSAAYSELQTRSIMILRSIYDSVAYAELVTRQLDITRVLSDSFAYDELLVKSYITSLDVYDYVEYGEYMIASQYAQFSVSLYDSVVYYDEALNSVFRAFTSSLIQLPYTPGVSDIHISIVDTGLMVGAVVGLLGMALWYSKRKKDTHEDDDLIADEFGENE